jgi:hypothetical protein
MEWESRIAHTVVKNYKKYNKKEYATEATFGHLAFKPKIFMIFFFSEKFAALNLV